MKVPKRLDIVGTVELVKYQYAPAMKNRNIRTFSPTGYLLAVNEARTILFIFKSNPVSGAKRLTVNQEIVTGIEYDIPDVDLRKTGIVKSIQYTSNWFSRSYARWEHVFEKSPSMYTDKMTRFGVIAIKHARGPILSNESGIIG